MTGTTGLMLWIGAMVAVIVVVAVLKSRRRPIPYMRREIARLDLGAVRTKAMKRHGWSEGLASTLESEYRDFLVLIAENGGVISPWSDALDLFWHEHILDTARYARDCKRIFGRVIQHDPHIEKNPYRHASTINRTVALREAQLAARSKRQAAAASGAGGAATSSDGFDLVTWGCSSDSGHSSHGSHGHSCGASHGGDHGGGHSCGGHGDAGGGHSCGGHSCGGHGCGGGGCGGH